jgi:hypothetical protein
MDKAEPSNFGMYNEYKPGYIVAGDVNTLMRCYEKSI